MSLADFHATYTKLRDDDIATVYRDEENAVTGALYRGTLISLNERMEVSAAAMRGDLATAERRAHAVLAMCEWMRKVQKGEVK